MMNARIWALSGLILGSLVFSVGGVAIVGRADGANSSPAPAAASNEQTPAAAQAKPECTPPQRHEVRAHVVDTGDVTVLNTRGYNYPLPSEIHRPEPPSRKDEAPAPAAKPAGAPSSP